MQALRDHFPGEGKSTKIIVEVERMKKSLQYKNERSLSFEMFLPKFQKMFNIYDKERKKNAGVCEASILIRPHSACLSPSPSRSSESEHHHWESSDLHYYNAFMHAVRRSVFGQKYFQGNTVRNTLGHVEATFVESDRPSPVKDTIGNTHNHIERQTKGYKRLDPSTQHKKALPPIFFENILQQALLPRERAQASLICVALFFATRSCKYTYVGKGERRTRPIILYEIVFRKGAQVLSHEGKSLHSEETVSIDFGE